MTSPYQVEPGFGIGFSQGTANGKQHGENLIVPEIKAIFSMKFTKAQGAAILHPEGPRPSTHNLR
jgi:hypothetical protein